RGTVLGAVDEVVEESGTFGLTMSAGVVSLADEHGDELGGGGEVAAGLADRLERAAELDGARAEPVAEHAGVLAAQTSHRRALGGKMMRAVIEGLDFGAHGE